MKAELTASNIHADCPSYVEEQGTLVAWNRGRGHSTGDSYNDRAVRETHPQSPAVVGAPSYDEANEAGRWFGVGRA